MAEENPEAILMRQHLLTLQGPTTGMGLTFLGTHTVDCQLYLPGLNKHPLRTCSQGNRIYHWPTLQAQRGLPKSIPSR